MQKLVSFFSFIREFFEYILTGPRLGWLLFFMLIGVFNIPFRHAFHTLLHLGTPATAFFHIPHLDNMLLFLHISAAIPAIFLGPLLFIPAYRKAYPSHHRFMGKIYVYGCLISAVTVFPLAVVNKAGFIAHLGFGTMAVVWFCVTYFAFTATIHKNFVTHRRWMMRSYAMTFAFVHVNFTYHLIGVYSGVFDVTGIKIFQSMISWLSGLFLVELYLAATAINGRWLGFKKWFYNLSHWSPADKFFWSMFR